jgi:hypothetical protein
MGVVVDRVADIRDACVDRIWQLFGQRICVDAGRDGDVLNAVNDFYGHIQCGVAEGLRLDLGEEGVDLFPVGAQRCFA